MVTARTDLVKEIRINPRYTQYLMSEFPDGDKSKESQPIIVRRTLFTNEYMKKLTGATADRGILPPNCRFIEATNKGYLVVIEEPPAIRTVQIQKYFEHEIEDLKNSGTLKEFGYEHFDPRSDKINSFSLAFPYVVFILSFERETRLIDGLVFFRTQQMRGMSDYLLKAPLTNISDNQRVCFGDANKFAANSLTQAIQNVIMVFWSAVFNTDYTYNYSAYQKEGSEFGNYLRWEYLTTQNPLFIYDAKWIQLDKNLGQMMQYVKDSDHLVGNKIIDYNRAAEMVFAPIANGEQAKITRRSKKTQPLYHDIANGMYVGEYFLNIGDPFTNNRGEILHIESFIGFSDGGRLKYIMVDKNGKKFLMKLTTKVKNYIAFSNKALRYSHETVLPFNNLKIKTGDLLIFKNKNGAEYYGAVDFIRAGRDGRTEVKVGKDYYIAENIEASLFKMDNPAVYGIRLKKDERYIYIRDVRSTSPMMTASLVTYDKIRIRNSSNIEFQFINASERYGGSSHHMPLKAQNDLHGKSYQRLFRESEVRTFDSIFRIGKKMYYLAMPNDDRTPVSENLIWEIPEMGVGYESNYSLRRPKVGMVTELIKDDVFTLPGFLLDVQFSVGDKVIVADWKNPYEMLRVKEIAGFSVVERAGRGTEDIYFILSDKDGKLSKTRYVNGYQGICNIGRVRKITNIWNRVAAGTKIISREAGYSGFPKKAANIIIGFIYDTGGEDPLVLCSNGQTLWFNDMMKDFTRVTMKSKRWATLSHAPIDLSKIKPQPGDIINGTKEYRSSEGYLMMHLPNQYRGLRAQRLEYYTGYPESHALDSRLTREYIYDCIPNPRIRPAQIEEMGKVACWPNFHGLFYESVKSEYHFINEPGRIINVQSSDK